MADTNLRVRLQHAYKTEAEWEATTTIPKAGEILLTKDGLHKNWRKTGDGVHRWSELEYDKPTYDHSEIQPIKSKLFSNVTCTANNDPNGYLYFATIRPTSYNSQWRVTYKVTATINNQVSGYQYSEVTIDGKLNTYSAYRTYNAILNTNYRPLYSHLLHSTSETGFNNEYPHLLGVRLYSSWNPSVAANSREILIEIMEVKNCTLTFLDSMTVFANMPGSTTTNYGNASSGAYATRVNFDGTTQGITISGDRNTYPYFDSLYYTKPLAGTNGIKQYSLIMEDSDGRYQSFTTDYGTGTSKTKNPLGFKLGKIYYASTGSNFAANAQYGNDVTRSFQYSVDARYSFNCGQTLTAYAPLYLVGTYNPTTNLFYLDNTWYTQTLPTEEDGKIYIYLGLTCNTYQFDFVGYSTPLYYKDGAMRPFVAPEATPTLTGLMSSSDKSKLDIYTMAETIVPGGQGKATGWYRIAKISGATNRYANFTLYTNGFWSTGSPTVGLFQLCIQNATANIVQLSGILGSVFQKIRLVKDGNTANYFVDLYQNQTYTGTTSMGTQYFTFIGHGGIETYQPESPLEEEATAQAELEIKSNGVVAANFYGNLTGNATTATTATKLSTAAASSAGDRPVWVSWVGDNTRATYDTDFTYDSNTNTLKVNKIYNTELTGTPTAPTAADGTNTTQIATTAFVQNAVGNTEIGGRNLFLKDPKSYDASGYCVYQLNLSERIQEGTYTIQFWDVDVSHTGKSVDQLGVSIYIGGGTNSMGSIFGPSYFTDGHADHLIKTFTVSSAVAAHANSDNLWFNIYNSVPNVSGTRSLSIGRWKLEKGNKPTDWTPAPEDLVSNISLSGSTLSYSNPIGTQLGSYTLSKSNVGLGNVDNTSDANKPISTATQTALDQITSTIGNAKLFTGTCSTAAGTAEKAVTCTAFQAADLVVGSQISVLFSNTNSAAAGDLKLNVNSTGAKSIKYVYNDSYSNLPGVGYLKANQIYRFIYDGTYWVIDMMYNTNTTPAYLEYRNNTYAKKALTAESLIVGDKDGYEKVAANVVFDLSYPILWCTAAVAQGGNNYANMFLQHYDRNIGYIKSGYTSSAKKMIYLVVTISGNSATVDSSIITDTLPSEDDGKAYITLGRLGQQSTGANYFLFQATHPIFVFKKGALRLYSGSADVVNGHTVEADVPSGAVFTDKNVTQVLTTSTADLPILLSNSGINDTTTYVTSVAHRSNSIYANPSTGILTAPYLRSTHYLQAQNKVYGVASSVSSGRVDECILYTGIKFENASFMPVIHITGYYYANAMPLDLTIVFYIYSGSICNMGVTSAGSWQPDVYLFKYTSDAVDYIAVALRTPAVYYPTVHADILNNAVTGLASNTKIVLSKFNWQFTAKDATSVIPEPDNGVTCIQVPYKVNSNPKPKLTFQMAGTDSAAYDGTGTATFNVTKSGIGLGNVENKSSATIRGELTASNVTTALGYTPANVTALNGYIPYGGNDNGLGSGTTAEKAKEYFADATKIPNDKVKFYYNNSGNEYTTIFSKAPNASYGSVIKWGYSDKYFRILRYSASNWATDDWEKMDAGYADSAGYALSIANSALSTENVDTFIENGRLKWGKIGTYDIGWGGKDGFIISIPWSANFARQIAYDDQSTWTATRAMNNGTWSDWDRIVTKTYGDTLYIPKGGPVNSDLYTNSLDGAKTILCKNSLVTTSTSLVGDANTNLTTSTNISEWLKALLKQICIEYPNYANTTFRGWITPSSSGYYEVFIYNTNNIDSTTGLPQYSYGTFRQYVNTYVVFSTNSYTYSQESLVTHSNWTNWITTSSIGAIPLTGSTAITGHLITRGTGEVQIGVGYTTENTARKLYLWGNNSSGSRGLYDDKRGYVINVADTGVTFTGSLSGNATTATNLTTLKSTLSANLGIDTLDKNAIGYVSGLTAANWNYQRSDGALYSQFYSANWQHQIYGDYRTGQISIRGKNNGTWQDWRRVLDESNYNTIIDATKLTIPASSGATLQYNDTDKFALQNPFAHIWHDLFAFCRVAVPKYYTTTDGTTWTEATLNKEIFAHKNQTSIAQNIISSSISGSRWVWNSGFSYSNGYWLVLGVNYLSTIAKFDVLLESSADGTTWTTLCDSKNISCNQNYIWIKTTRSAQARMRLTITRNSSSANTTELPVSSIQLMSSRPGGSGYGPEYSYPYDWDGEKNITFLNNITVDQDKAYDLGSSTRRMATVYSNYLNISGATNATMTAASTNPKIIFSENGSQPVHLIYSDYDSYRAPAGLKVIGGTSATPAWFEVEGDIYEAGTKLGSKYLALSGGTLTGNLAFGSLVRGSVFPSHYYHNLYSDSDSTVYVHYYPVGANTVTKAEFRVKAESGYKTLVFSGNGTFAWGGQNVITAAGGTITGNLTVNGTIKAGSSTTTTLPTTGYMIHDCRDAELLPSTGDKAMNLYFAISSNGNNVMPTNGVWYSLIHMRGWTGQYTAWELAGPAHNTDQSTHPLYVRTSNKNTAWGDWRKIYDSYNKPTPAELGVSAINDTGTSYLFNKGAYTGGSGAKKYIRITLPNSQDQIWNMIHLEVSLRKHTPSESGGKILIQAVHSSASPYTWSGLSASVLGYLPNTLTVYSSDGKYFYILNDTTYSTASLNRILIGDTARGVDLSGVTIDYVDTLPETYQTATMYYGLHSGNYNSYALPLTGGQLTGDLTFYAASGNSPAIIFQRGTDSDTLTDWKIIDSSGNLLFQCRDSSATNNAWTTKFTLGYNGVLTATSFTGHASLDLPLTAGSSVPLSNSLYITKAGECGVEVNNTQTTNPNQVAFIVGSSGNGGIYSRKHNKWIVYANASGDVVLNGNATSATSATTAATATNATSAYELKQISGYNYSNRPTSANIDANNNGGLRRFLATGSMTTGKPNHDAHIIHLDWDNSNTYAAQIASLNTTEAGRLATRSQKADKSWTDWSYVYDTAHKPTGVDTGVFISNTNINLNEVYDSGIYNTTGGSATNTPKGYGYGQVLTMAYRKPIGNTTPDYASQLYMHNGNSASGPGNVLYYRTSTQTTWNDWQQVAHGTVNTAIGSTSQPVYMDTDGTLKVTNLKINDIAPMATKTYTGLYGSANDAAGASFYFMTVKPTTYYTIWKIKYRVHCWVPNKNYYDSYADVEIWGYQSTYSSYKIFNAHSYEGSTIRRPFYFHNFYRATQAGSSAYGHAIGLGLRAGSEPTNSAYPRTFTVELLDTENCTATLFDDAVKYANLPGTGSTNYAALTEFDGYNVGLRESGDDNDTTTVRDYYEHLTAGTNGMKQYSLVMEDADGKWQSFTTTHGTATNKAKNTVGFRLGKIFYLNLSGNIAANAKNGDNVVTSHMTNLNFQYSSNCGSTLTADKPLFIKGTYNYQTGLFYLADTWWAQDFPTSDDGFIYIQVGFARSTTNYDFNNTLPTYWYHDGVVRQFTPPVYVLKSGDTMTGDLVMADSTGIEFHKTFNSSDLNVGLGAWQKLSSSTDIALFATNELYAQGSVAALSGVPSNSLSNMVMSAEYSSSQEKGYVTLKNSSNTSLATLNFTSGRISTSNNFAIEEGGDLRFYKKPSNGNLTYARFSAVSQILNPNTLIAMYCDENFYAKQSIMARNGNTSNMQMMALASNGDPVGYISLLDGGGATLTEIELKDGSITLDGSAKITDALEVNNQIYVPNSTNVSSGLSITTLSSAAQLSYINSSDTNADGTIIEFTSSDINVACDNMEINGTLSVTNGLKDAHSVTSYTVDNVSVAPSTVVALKTVSLTAGKYLVIYGGQFATNNNGYRCLFFTNSSDTLSNLGGRYGLRIPAVSGSITVMNGAQILKPTGTTTYGLYAYQTSGTTLASYGFFHIIRL